MPIQRLECALCSRKKFEVVMPYRTIEQDKIFLDSKIIQCSDCKLLQIDKEFSEDEISDYYKFIYNRKEIYKPKPEEFPLDNTFSVSRGRALAELFIKYNKNFDGSINKILDLGCSYGHLLYGFTNKVKVNSVIGVDYDCTAQSVFDKMGWEFSQGGIEDYCQKYTNQIDILITSHVFEHVINPHKFLALCKNTLSDNGVLLWEMPNLNKFHLECESRHSPHICLWDINSLHRVLTMNNFDVIFIGFAGRKYKWYDKRNKINKYIRSIRHRLMKEPKEKEFDLNDPNFIGFNLNNYGGETHRSLRVLARKI